MKITDIEIYKSTINLSAPFRVAIAHIEKCSNLFIRINTDAGLYGMGEVAPFWAVTGETHKTAFMAARDLASMMLGRNPFAIQTRNAELHGYLAHNSALRCGFDVALHDLLGKASGLPVYSLLGGQRRSFLTDCTIGMDTPEAMARKAVYLKDSGFTELKVKLGTGMKDDILRIQSIREAIGPQIPLRVDANQGWDYTTAVSILRKFEPFGIEYCEQPLAAWDYENMRRLREKSAIPIAADESVFDNNDAFKLAATGCCDILNIKLAKSGGIHTAVKIDAIAESAGMKCMLGCRVESRLGLSAGAHLVSARPNIKFVDLDGHFELTEDPVVGGVEYNGPEVLLPDTPGLGADIDPAFLKTCESVVIK